MPFPTHFPSFHPLLEAVQPDEQRPLLLRQRLRQARQLAAPALLPQALALQAVHPRLQAPHGAAEVRAPAVRVAVEAARELRRGTPPRLLGERQGHGRREGRVV